MSENKPLVSFILPVYNSERFLAETLHSIIEQTYDNFEVIAINDGSKDDSLKVLRRYAEFDKRIKVFTQKNNGLVYTLNRAIELSSGEFLVRIDSDDLCVPKRLEWQLAKMEKNPKAVLCTGAYELIDEEGTFLGINVVPTRSEDIKMLMYTRNPIAHASVMLRKSMLPEKPYNNSVGPTEDYELWSRLAIEHDLVAVPRVIMRYRINTSGIMHTIGHKQWSYMKTNFDNYWKNIGSPKPMSPIQVRNRIRHYVLNEKHYGYGISMLRTTLDGMCQASVKMIKRGDYSKGIKMLLGVTFSSKTGLKTVAKRISLIIKNTIVETFSKRQSKIVPDNALSSANKLQI